MRSALIALAYIYMFSGFTSLVSTLLNDGVQPKINCCCGSSYNAEFAVDSRKQETEIISDYDYSDPDPSPINSHVHGAPIQNNAQAPSPAPTSSQVQHSRETSTLSSPSPQ